MQSIKLFLSNLLFAIFWKFNLAISYLQIYWRKTTRLLYPSSSTISKPLEDNAYIYVDKNTQYSLSNIEEMNGSWMMAHIEKPTGEKIVRIDNNLIPRHGSFKSKADILQVCLYTGVMDPENLGIDMKIADYLYQGNQILSKEFIQYYLDMKHPSLAIDLDKTNYWVDVMDGNTFEIQQVDMNHYLEIGENDYKVLLREEK